MDHNDAEKGTQDDPPIDPDATEVVAMDLEALLHMELDAQKSVEKEKAASVPRLRAALPASMKMPTLLPPRRSSSRLPISRSAIPRMPIHTLPPPAPEEDDEDPTAFYDRKSVKSSLPSVKTPSVKSVSFPAADFAAPRAPLPFTIAAPHTEKLDAGSSMGVTAYQPLLPPTSRRDLVAPSAFESLAPMSMGAGYSSYPPAAAKKSNASTWALVLTLTFSLASMALMSVALLKPDAIDRLRGKPKPAAAAAAAAPPAVVAPAEPAPPTTIAVPPVLFEDGVIEEVGDDEAYVVFPDSARGRRLFIDGRVVGEGNDKGLLVPCGKHKVQLGSSGTPKPLDLPCGGGWRLAAD